MAADASAAAGLITAADSTPAAAPAKAGDGTPTTAAGSTTDPEVRPLLLLLPLCPLPSPPRPVHRWTGLCILLYSRERGSSQRAVGVCSCGCEQRTAGWVRSLTQLPSLWESAETRHLAQHRLRSGLVYPAAVTRERFEQACC